MQKIFSKAIIFVFKFNTLENITGSIMRSKMSKILNSYNSQANSDSLFFSFAFSFFISLESVAQNEQKFS